VIRSVASDGRPNVGGVFRPIDRPRVLDRLATAAQYRITTIIAPAGFGKSVALRQFLATVPASVIYDVPADATTLIPFVRGFADALADVAPGMRRSLATALDGAVASQSPGRDLGVWAANHVRSLEMLIALDDLHVGEGDPEVSRFIATLIDRSSGGPRWLLSSRTMLELPVASWLAYGESDLTIDTVDLRFTVNEARESARASRVAVRDEELSAIIDLVDGWPTALAFALRVSVRASDLRALAAGTREMVYRYLAEQVWKSLDDRMRGFLRTIAFLPRMDLPLAIAAGFDDAAAIIEMLRERVAFVTVLDAGIYKLHDLFRDFILHQIRLEGDEALRAAIVNAGRILETAGETAAALERYIEANADDDVARVLADVNFALLESGHYDVASRAVRMLSGSRLLLPGVLAVRAAIEESFGRVEQAEKLYDAALLRTPDNVSFQVSVAWRYGLLLFQQGRFDAMPRLEALAARSDVSDADRANLEGSLAQMRALAGDLTGARAALERAIPLADFADDLTRARTYGRASTVAFYAGDEDAVERLTREAIRVANEVGAYQLAARFNSTLCSAYMFKGHLPTAAWHASQIVNSAGKAGNALMQALGLRDLVFIEAQRGNVARIAELERELNSLSYRGPVALASMVCGKGLALIAERKFAEAQRVLATLSRKEITPYQDRARIGLLAFAAAANEDRPQAMLALEDYSRAVAADVDDRPLFGRITALGERFAILANIVAGRNAVALRALRGIQAVPTGFDGFDAGLRALANRAPDLLDTAVRQLENDNLAGLARALDAAASCLEVRVETPGELTTAELQVLGAMGGGLSNKAIADSQGRTINTVRTHVSSILRKLGCESRGEAVATAHRLGLIQP
jgi:ATP/maltotriose-dependent transcriptional regulator MalT